MKTTRYCIFVIAGLILASCGAKGVPGRDIELGVSTDDVSAQLRSDYGDGAGNITNDDLGGAGYKGKIMLFHIDGTGKLTFGKSKKLIVINWQSPAIPDSVGSGIIVSLKQKLGQPEPGSDTLRWFNKSNATAVVFHSGILDYNSTDMAGLLDYTK